MQKLIGKKEEKENNENLPKKPKPGSSFKLIKPLGILILLGILAFFFSQHFYFFKKVNPDEIGIRQRGGRIVEVVGPGLYSDVGLYVELETYSTQEYDWVSTDPEVITLDQQRLGVVVSGSIFRPSITDVALVKSLWTKYKTLYTSDLALQKKMDELSFQAMKVCVGDRSFSDSVIGSDRDSLRQCIEEELDGLTQPFGLVVQNVVVPNVTLSPEVQAKLDAITQARLDTEKAEQDRLKAIAEGAAEQAQQEAEIRVEQSKLQEQARQETILAQLEQEKLNAQMSVIEAQKENELVAAQKDLEINTALAAAYTEKAKADLAQEMALAEIYESNPNYYLYMLALANANAIKDSDKLIFTPEGVFPQLVFGDTLTPVVPVGE